MLPLRIENHTRIMAKGQDEYHDLAIRDEPYEVNGVTVNAMVSAWEPTPTELATLNAGGSVRLYILGSAFPPVAITVAPAPQEGGEA